MSVFNETPEEFYDLNELFPVLNSRVGLTYVQFQKLVENTIWLKNREDKIGVVYSYVAGGSPSQFGQYWLSATDGGTALIPDTNFIYIMLSSGNFEKWLFRWNGTTYEPLNKDFESYASATNFPITGISNIFYLALDTSVIYYWSGTAYVEASGTDLTNYYTKTETNTLLDDKADKNRIQNVDNSSYFEAGGNVNNTVGDTEQETYFTQFKTGTSQGHFDITNSKFVMGGYSKNDGDGENFTIVITSGDFPSGTIIEKFVMSENRTNEDEVAKILDIPKVVSDTDVVVAVEDWVEDTTYTDYDYKAVLTLTGMLATYEPSVVFGLAEIESGNYASVCLAGTDTITIYAKEIPSASITLPLIKGEQL